MMPHIDLDAYLPMSRRRFTHPDSGNPQGVAPVKDAYFPCNVPLREANAAPSHAGEKIPYRQDH